MVSSVFSISFPGLPLLEQGNRADSILPLDCFVGGDENRLVRLACEEALASEPRYCPLMFVGPNGTGKSLLARGLVSQWNAASPSCRRSLAENGNRPPAVLLTAADLARQLAEAYETDSLDEFRAAMAHHSRIVIEDLHHLEDKEASQLELARLIDRQNDECGLVIATAPQLPAELPGITPALVSRLSGGLTVPVSLPGRSAREEILRRLAAAHRVVLDDETVGLLAGSSPDLNEAPHLAQRQVPWSYSDDNALPDPIPFSTPLQLHHAIVQLKALAEQHARPIDSQLTRQLLGDRQCDPQPPSLSQIVRAVAGRFQVSVSDLRGPSRRQTLSQCRGLAMLLARQETDLSLEEIGRYFGDRDHTTVLHACRTTSRRLAMQPNLHATFTDLQSKLQQPSR